LYKKCILEGDILVQSSYQMTNDWYTKGETMYQHLQTSRLYEQLAERIKDRIVNDKLKVGDRLPNEYELAEQYGVSRTVVREAMKTLAKEGLVQVRPGRGTFVVSGLHQAVKDSINSLLLLDKSEDWHELIEVRELLEPGIAFLAAERAEAEDIVCLQKAVEIMDSAMNDSEAYIAADNNFHQTLARATRNEILVTLVEPIVGLLTVQRKRIFDVKEGPQRGQFHHKRILEAVRSHNPEMARLASIEHLHQVRDASHK
jgi:GntR family transcriptional repressor for pyruvate dehydrogenase complex